MTGDQEWRSYYSPDDFGAAVQEYMRDLAATTMGICEESFADDDVSSFVKFAMNVLYADARAFLHNDGKQAETPAVEPPVTQKGQLPASDSSTSSEVPKPEALAKPSGHAPRPADASQLETDVRAAFEHLGEASPTAVARLMGHGGGKRIFREIQELILRWADEGVLVVAGQVRGHPIYRLAGAVSGEGGGSEPPPERSAGAAEVAAPGGPSAASADDLPSDEERAERGAASQNVDLRILAALREPRTAGELCEELGLDHRSVGGRIQRLSHRGRIEDFGHRAGETVWRKVPLPSERPGVTVRTVSTNGSQAGTRILGELAASGGLSVAQLAARLVLHPSVISGALGALKGQGRVEQVAGGKWATRLETVT